MTTAKLTPLPPPADLDPLEVDALFSNWSSIDLLGLIARRVDRAIFWAEQDDTVGQGGAARIGKNYAIRRAVAAAREALAS